MRIGIIYCAFNCEEYVKDSIRPLILAREQKLSGHEWVIAGINVCFKEYKETKYNVDDSTGDYLATQNLDYLIREPQYISEAEARTLALRKLLDDKCELIFLIDGDELFQINDLQNITKFIEEDKFSAWYKFSYKNYLFDSSTYLKLPFQPPRAFRVQYNGYRLNNFRHDNEVVYHGIITRDIKDFESFPSKIIPPNISWIVHKTWISCEKTKSKVEYQRGRWGGSLCSYKWDETNNKLVFNPQYFARFGKPIPELIKE